MAAPTFSKTHPEHDHLRQAPQGLQELIDKGTHEAELANWDGAEAHFRQALEQAVEGKETALAQYYLAGALSAQGRAAEAFGLMVEQQGFEAEAYGAASAARIGTINRLAEALRKEQTTHLAELVFEWAVRLNESSEEPVPMVYFNYASMLHDEEQYDRALPLLTRFLEFKKQLRITKNAAYARALQGIADVHRRRKNYKEAGEFYAKAIEHHILHNNEAERVRGYRHLGRFHLECQKLEEAETAFQRSAAEARSVESLPSRMESVCLLARTYFMWEKKDQAFDTINQSLQEAEHEYLTHGKWEPFIDHLSAVVWHLADLGYLDQGKHLYTNILAQLKKHEQHDLFYRVQLETGEFLDGLGEWEAAAHHYEQALLSLRERGIDESAFYHGVDLLKSLAMSGQSEKYDEYAKEGWGEWAIDLPAMKALKTNQDNELAAHLNDLIAHEFAEGDDLEEDLEASVE